MKRFSFQSLLALIVFITTQICTSNSLCIFGNDTNCFFPCHCAGDNPGSCDRYTGACQNGCKKGNPLLYGNWQSDGCLLGNVAYQKPTFSNTVINRTIKNYNRPQLWYNTNNTVDGTMKLRVFDGSCTVVYTANKTTLPWLMVDLLDQYVIPKIVLINTDNSVDSSYLENFYVKIGNTSNITEQETCRKFYRKIRSAGKETITCTRPITGRYVTVVKYSERNKVGRLPLCEFVVFGFKPIPVEWDKCFDNSRYNMFCQKCIASIPPDCMKECPANSYGMYCEGSCGHCNNSEPCDKITGKCDVCELGWQPPRCNTSCPNNTYGVGCAGICGNCANHEQCSLETGYCPTECQQWYAKEDPLCKTYIPIVNVGMNPKILFIKNTWAMLMIPNDIPFGLRNYYRIKLYYMHEKDPLGNFQDYTDFKIHFDNNTNSIKIEIDGLTKHTQYWFMVQIYRSHNGVLGGGEKSETIRFMTLDRDNDDSKNYDPDLPRNEDQNQPNASPSQLPPNQQHVNTLLIVLVVILAALLLALAIGGGIFIYRRRGMNNSNNTKVKFGQTTQSNNNTVPYSPEYDEAVHVEDDGYVDSDTLAIIQ